MVAFLMRFSIVTAGLAVVYRDSPSNTEFNFVYIPFASPNFNWLRYVTYKLRDRDTSELARTVLDVEITDTDVLHIGINEESRTACLSVLHQVAVYS